MECESDGGGRVWTLDDGIDRFKRFLLLGHCGDTYYVENSRMLTENVNNVEELIENSHGDDVVVLITQYASHGRCTKKEPLVFALAVCAKAPKTSQAALRAVKHVCETPSHLFLFLKILVKILHDRRWPRFKRKAIAEWYTARDCETLASSVTKYKQRYGWTHRDVFRLCHPKPKTPAMWCIFQFLYNAKTWATSNTLQRYYDEYVDNDDDDASRCHFPSDQDVEQYHKTYNFLRAVYDLRMEKDSGKIVKAISHFKLNREHVPNHALNLAEVWIALVEHMPILALVRSLSKLSQLGLFEKLHCEVTDEGQMVDMLSNYCGKGYMTAIQQNGRIDLTTVVCQRLISKNESARNRLHPFQLLVATLGYSVGRSTRGRLRWQVDQIICDALEQSFFISFQMTKPTGKRLLLAIDVSSSMGSGGLHGVDFITPAVAAAAIALITARQEPNSIVIAFSDELVEVDVSRTSSLADVIRQFSEITMGTTDCSFPIKYALKEGLQIDAFVIYTDCQATTTEATAKEALDEYRAFTMLKSKLIVCGMASNGFTIADQNEDGVMNEAGFDVNFPRMISEFINK